VFREMIDGLKFNDVALGFVLPGAIVLTVLFAAARSPRHAGLLGALAFAEAVFAGYFALELGPLIPSDPGNRWLPHLALLAVPAGWLAGFARPAHFVWPMLMVTAVACAAATVPDWIGMMILWGVMVGYASFGGTLGFVYADIGPTAHSLALLATSMAAAFMTLQASMTRLSFICPILVATGLAAFTSVILGNRDPERAALRGISPGFVALVNGIMFSNYLGSSSNVPPSCYALVALAPIGLFVGRLPLVRRLPKFGPGLAALCAVIAVLAIAVARAAMA
jgi:hypothetical protein